MTVVNVWEHVVGQDDAVAWLQRAATQPGHAYLLVGARGSGVEEAARCFAAALIAPEGDARTVDLALRGVHPDVVEVDPPANQIRIEDAQTIIDEAYRSPIEGARKVIIVLDAERLNDTAANKLLKTLEEPPPTALLVLVTAGADQLLATIRSRCQRVDFAYRPRVPDARLVPVRDAFVAAAGALDGTGAAVAAQVDAVQDALRAATADLEATQADETAELEAELEAAGFADRTRRAQLRRLAERQKRTHRYFRTEALIEGISALESVYRDALAPDAEPLNPGVTPLEFEPRACGRALDACRSARQALMEHNPNEALLLERLFLNLPSGGTTRRR
jgi:DNA polymerase-3 subunit delta'